MKETQLTLTLQQLYIAYHGIKERLKRAGISERDKEEEEKALDVINQSIREILMKNKTEAVKQKKYLMTIRILSGNRVEKGFNWFNDIEKVNEIYEALKDVSLELKRYEVYGLREIKEEVEHGV